MTERQHSLTNGASYLASIELPPPRPEKQTTCRASALMRNSRAVDATRLTSLGATLLFRESRPEMV